MKQLLGDLQEILYSVYHLIRYRRKRNPNREALELAGKAIVEGFNRGVTEKLSELTNDTYS